MSGSSMTTRPSRSTRRISPSRCCAQGSIVSVSMIRAAPRRSPCAAGRVRPREVELRTLYMPASRIASRAVSSMRPQRPHRRRTPSKTGARAGTIASPTQRRTSTSRPMSSATRTSMPTASGSRRPIMGTSGFLRGCSLTGLPITSDTGPISRRGATPGSMINHGGTLLSTTVAGAMFTVPGDGCRYRARLLAALMCERCMHRPSWPGLAREPQSRGSRSARARSSCPRIR